MGDIKTSLGHYLVKELKSTTPLVLLDSEDDGNVVDKFSFGKLIITIKATVALWTVDLDFNGEFTLRLPVYTERDWERELDPEGDFFTFVQVCCIISQYDQKRRK